MVKKRRITLPDNPHVKTRLQKKIEEYQKRVLRLKKSNQYKNPDMVYTTIAGYKALIAQRLTQRGEVDTEELSKELREEYGFLDFNAFNNAAGVIDDYCKTGGKNVVKGSGF